MRRLVMVAVLVAGCGGADEGPSLEPLGPTLSSIQAHVFTPKCAGCHQHLPPRINLTDGQSYGSLVNKRSRDGLQWYVKPGEPASSMLVNGSGSSGHDGIDADPDRPTDWSTIADWIEAGALDN